MAGQPPQPQGGASPWPLYDLFLDVPHPGASPGAPSSRVLGIPRAKEGNHDSIEQELSKSMPQISRFAFPEYDPDTTPPPSQEIPINRFDQYAMQPPAFQNYTFSLQLQSGMRVYGHVRRYLPCHRGAKTRYDVGRRGERALVILTRVTGADVIYAAMLKTIDGISSHQNSLLVENQQEEDPVRDFLYDMFTKHQQIAQMYSQQPANARKNKPVFLTITNLEVRQDGPKRFAAADSTHFLLTQPLLLRTSMGDLVSNTSKTSILPVLRCLGVAHTLRLLCALLCERRVILISASPTRLATCCKSAIAMLAQGLLHWQHLYIPVLPPHLWQYLAAPYPYLIGILASLTPRLDRTDGLGEVLIINLDQNIMETRGIPTDAIEDRIPDLLRNMNSNDTLNMNMSITYGANSMQQMSAPQALAQDLVELMKNDKKILYGESTLANMQDTAVKATKAVRKTFAKLKEQSKKYMSARSMSGGDGDSSREDDLSSQDASGTEPGEEVNSMAPDFIYTEGCRNEIGEEESRIAFCCFFLSMIGNMRWYLSAQPGQQPQLDRKRFLQQKRAGGEGEYSAMWPLLQNFCQTQMFEEFAKLRVEEMRTRQPVTSDSPLFLQCSNYHIQSKSDFDILSVRRISRQVSQSNPSNMLQQTSARRMAMELTSKRPFEGDYNKALADLVEQCRESSSVLFDVMSVVWIRMRDNRGMQWKHATNSLHILKNLLFHGPLAAVAEATDGLDKIRALKYYNGNRQTSICVQIRAAATQVYNLIVDRSKLFHIRRVCISKRRSLKSPTQGKLTRDTRLWKVASVTFQKVHAAMHPNAPKPAATAPRTPPPQNSQPAYNATPTFAVLPPSTRSPAPPQPAAVTQRQPSGHDLLGLSQPPQPAHATAAAPVAANAEVDIFGVFGSQQQKPPPSATPSNVSSDMLGLFTDMSIGTTVQSQPAVTQSTNQFEAATNNQFGGAPVAPAHTTSSTLVHQDPRSRSVSPKPPQHFAQQAHQTSQYVAQQQPAAFGAPQQRHQGGALSPRSQSPMRPHQAPPPAQYAAHQQQAAYAMPPHQQSGALSPPRSQSPMRPQQHAAFNATGYQAQQPGQVPGYSQPPNSGGYPGQISPHPQQGQYPPQQYPGAMPGYYAAGQGQQPPQQQQMPPKQGPFF